MPVITVTLVEGRSEEQIRRLVSAMATSARDILGADPADIVVVIDEKSASRIAHGDETVAERKAAAAGAGERRGDGLG